MSCSEEPARNSLEEASLLAEDPMYSTTSSSPDLVGILQSIQSSLVDLTKDSFQSTAC